MHKHAQCSGMDRSICTSMRHVSNTRLLSQDRAASLRACLCQSSCNLAACLPPTLHRHGISYIGYISYTHSTDMVSVTSATSATCRTLHQVSGTSATSVTYTPHHGISYILISHIALSATSWYQLHPEVLLPVDGAPHTCQAEYLDKHILVQLPRPVLVVQLHACTMRCGTSNEVVLL